MKTMMLRNLCPHCKVPHEITEKEREWLGLSKDKNHNIFSAVGCKECNQLGYLGRSGLYEFIPIDHTLKNMIHEGEGEQAMEQYARANAPSLTQDGRRLILKGVTSLEEVLRVSRDD